MLSITGLGDMKLTALLCRLQSLNSDPTTLFRAHFLALLPSEVRSVLAGQDIPDILDLAKAADRIMEAKGLDSHVAPIAVQAASRFSNTASRFPIARRPATRQGGGDVEGFTESSHVCNYHVRYGKNARRCLPGCLLYDDSRGQPKTNGPRDKGAQGNASAGRP